MGVLSLLITLGTAIGSWFVASEADATNKALAEETIAFGEKELQQSHGEFLQSLGLQEDVFGLKQDEFAFSKKEAEKNRIERLEAMKFAKKKLGVDTGLGLFGQQSGLTQQMLDMWSNTGFVSTGAQQGTPQTQTNILSGQEVFSAH